MKLSFLYNINIIPFTLLHLLQEGGPLQGPETALLSNTWKLIVRGDTCADKARDFIGKVRPGAEHEGKGTQENFLVTWLAVSGFMVMGLFSWLSHLPSGAHLVQHGREEGSRRWSDMWCLLLTFAELFRLVEAY